VVVDADGYLIIDDREKLRVYIRVQEYICSNAKFREKEKRL